MCRKCPRLARYLDEVRCAHPEYHCAPVAAWGRADARLLIVGLAPGLHGANRTGRPFTGDASGTFLFRALARHGFASGADAAQASLLGARITNAVKCVPPGNRPTAAELGNCRGYLSAELAQLWHPSVRRPRCVLALGHVAHRAVVAALPDELWGTHPVRPAPPVFGHGAQHRLAPALWVVDTYHPSRQNTNTGRLTAAMLDRVLARVAALLRK
ncbi:MAG: uracil-DNA glycosylase [Pseudomonadales bacterium]